MRVYLQAIAAALPFLAIRHLQLVARIAVDYICPSTADLSGVLDGFLVSKFPRMRKVCLDYITTRIFKPKHQKVVNHLEYFR